MSVQLAMHVPDGYLTLPVSVFGWAVMALVLALTLTTIWQKVTRAQVVGVAGVAAFVFAAQMLNFPVAGGTSGHLIGGVVALVILGSPWLAVLAMTLVVVVQALVFQDGGVVTMGCNLVNMALVAPLVGYWLYEGLCQGQTHGTRHQVAVGAAAWGSVQAAALLASIELAFSHAAPMSVVLPAMLGVHALIGVGEALITLGAVSVVAWLQATQPQVARPVWVGMVMAAIVLVVLMAPLASPEPDGLERVAEDHGFAADALAPAYEVLPDYTVRGVDDAALSTVLAGVMGVVLTGGVALSLLPVSAKASR